MKELEVYGSWLSSRPEWQQEALKILCFNPISKSDRAALLAICKGLASPIKPKPAAQGAQVPKAATTDLKQIKILELSELEGIGSIKSSAPLKFEKDGMTVVYGRNGTGKSSYVRFLKAVSGHKHAKPLVGNVFEDLVKKKRAIVQFTVGDVITRHDWSEPQAIHDLKSVAIYDTHTGNIYVDGENEVSFEPHALKLLTDLTNLVSEFDAEITAEIRQMTSQLPPLTPQQESLPSAGWIKSLTKATKPADVKKLCAWSDDHAKKLQEIDQRLAEANPAEKAKHLRLELSKLMDLVKAIETALHLMSDDSIQGFITLRIDAKAKRSAADIFADTLFKDLPLDGIGEQVWKAMWAAAKAYSTTKAYPGVAFPPTKPADLCLLCLRPHDETSASRLQSFEKFVVGQLEKDAAESEKRLSESAALFQLPDQPALDTAFKEASLEGHELTEQISNLFTALRERNKSKDSAADIAAITALPTDTTIAALNMRATDLTARITTLDQDAAQDNRAALNAERAALAFQKWLHENEEKYLGEIERLNKVALLEAAKKQTATAPISKEKSTLSETLLTQAFVGRFQTELNKLGGGHIRVQLDKTRVAQSRVLHRILLKGVKHKVQSQEILSEGENRVVSLAAFLADLAGQKEIATFVFDDPISSLDQTYEQKTAQRLIELAKERQVIVFTHRLSLAHLLDVGRKVSLRAGGTPEELPVTWDKPKGILNRLMTERIS